MADPYETEVPPGSDRQWWLTEGTEFCFVCECHAHPEMMAYCTGCDRPVCFVCLADSDRNRPTLCPDCRARPTLEDT